MYTTTISTSTTPADKKSYRALLLKDLVEAKKHKSRIYRTYVDIAAQDKRYVLMTTSKDLHLKLGSLEWHFHHNLAKFLEEEFTSNRCYQLLLCFEDKAREAEEGILVSMTIEGGAVIFTLSPAR